MNNDHLITATYDINTGEVTVLEWVSELALLEYWVGLSYYCDPTSYIDFDLDTETISGEQHLTLSTTDPAIPICCLPDYVLQSVHNAVTQDNPEKIEVCEDHKWELINQLYEWGVSK
jgi:hypothetical protein